MNDNVTIKKAAEVTGMTEKAIRHNIDDGVWLVGREYFRAPNGRLFVNMPGFNKWVARDQGSPSTKQASASA